MKKLLTTHNGIDYEFRLLEAVNVIEVFKDNNFVYAIKQRRNKLYCNCPAGLFNRSCWHCNFALGIYKENSIFEPWVLWAEEAGIMEYNK